MVAINATYIGDTIFFTCTIPKIQALVPASSSAYSLPRASSASSPGLLLLKAPGHMSLEEVLPQVGDILGLLSGFFFAAQIFRAEMLCSKFDPLKLTAVQLVFMFMVASGWEAWTLGVGGGGLGPNLSQLEGQLSQLPWGPLLYSGLLAGGSRLAD